MDSSKKPNRVQELLNKALQKRSFPTLRVETGEVDLSTVELPSASTATPTTSSSSNKENVVQARMDEWLKRGPTPQTKSPKVNKRLELKKSIESRLAEQRREGIETRRHVFNADNEIFEDEEEEEEEEYVKPSRKKPVAEDSIPSIVENDTMERDFDEVNPNEEIKSIAGSDPTDYCEESNHTLDEEDVQMDEQSDEEQTRSPSQSDVDDEEEAEELEEQEDEEPPKKNRVSPQPSPTFETMEEWTDKMASLSMDAPDPPAGSKPLDENQISFLLNDDAFANMTDSQILQSAAEISGFEEGNVVPASQLARKQSALGDLLEEEEEEDEVRPRTSERPKRKQQIDSDDEDEAATTTTPGSTCRTPKKVVRFSDLNDELFTFDDGEDRIEMDAVRPFAERDTVRLILDDDDDEEEEEHSASQHKVRFAPKPTHAGSSQEDDWSSVQVEESSKNRGMIEEEAELSGDEVFSDDEEGEDGPDGDDEYEEEAGDADVLPDEDEMRNDLIKTHMKLQSIDEERRLNQLKEQFEGVLDPSNKWDRSFRSRLQDADFDFSALVGDPTAEGEQEQLQEAAEDVEFTFQQYLKNKELEAQQEQETHLFSLAAAAEDPSDDLTEFGEASSSNTQKTCSNPNAIAKFIVENYHMRSEDQPPS